MIQTMSKTTNPAIVRRLVARPAPGSNFAMSAWCMPPRMNEFPTKSITFATMPPTMPPTRTFEVLMAMTASG
jgi:hypothetical protein